MDQTYIAQNLRKLREEHKFTQKEVCKVIHIQRQAYSHYENGMRVPSLNTLSTLAHYYNIPIEYFLMDWKDQTIPTLGPSEELREVIGIISALPPFRQKELLSFLQSFNQKI